VRKRPPGERGGQGRTSFVVIEVRGRL